MRTLLEEAGLTIVGEGASWQDAERMAAGADVIVVDLWMPAFDLGALENVRALAPDATLAVITALALDHAAEKVASVEVDLLLSKSAPPEQVANAIAAFARDRDPVEEAG